MVKSKRNSFRHLAGLALFTTVIGFFVFSWAKSYFFRDHVSYERTTVEGASLVDSFWQIESADGGFELYSAHRVWSFATQEHAAKALASFHGSDAQLRWSTNFHPRYPSLGTANWHGFAWRHTSVSNHYLIFGVPIEHTFGIVVPYWALALVVAVLPIVITKRALGRRRLEKNQTLCQNCGYDLRASPARCPECGTLRPEMHAPIVMS
jgi:hypothetical protein